MGLLFSVTMPCSMRDMSRMSLISSSSWRLALLIRQRYLEISEGLSVCWPASWERPMMALRGVRMSWDMLLKKDCLDASFWRVISRESSSNLRSLSCCCFSWSTSRKESTTSSGERDSS